MEVHHHPKVEKKNFREYWKDFFIFLFLLSFHQAFSQNSHNDDIAAIKSNRAASNDAISRHDVDGIANSGWMILCRLLVVAFTKPGRTALWLHGKPYSTPIPKSLIPGIRRKLLSAIMILLQGNKENGSAFILTAKVAIMQRCGSDETVTGCLKQSCLCR